MGLFSFLFSLIPGVGTLTLLAQFLVGVIYPTYESFKAIESVGTKDDTQWLSYWVVFVIIQLVEKFLWAILRWVPLYGLLKVAGFYWLTAPSLKGATLIYQEFARPFLYSLVHKARDIPALEPYVRDFGSSATHEKVAKKVEAVGAQQATPAAAGDESFAPLKAHAQ